MATIYMKAQTHRTEFCSTETIEEATKICELYNWEFEDENGFVWSLEIDE